MKLYDTFQFIMRLRMALSVGFLCISWIQFMQTQLFKRDICVNWDKGRIP